MLPVCSTTSCSYHSQILLNDGFRYFSRSQKALDVAFKWLPEDVSVPRLSSGLSSGSCLQKEPVNSLYTDFLGGKKPLSIEWPFSTGQRSDSFLMDGKHLIYVEDSNSVVSPEDYAGRTVADYLDASVESMSKETTSILDNLADGAFSAPDASSRNTESFQTLGNSLNASISDNFADGAAKVRDASSLNSESLQTLGNTLDGSILDYSADGPPSVPDASSINTESLQALGNNFEDVSSQAKDSIVNLISKGGNSLNNSFDKTSSAITDIIKNVNEAFEKLTSQVLSSVDQTGELTRSKLSSVPNNLKVATNEAGGIGLELLRIAILIVEDSLLKAGKLVYYSYEATKEYLPQEIQNALGSFEGKTSEISRPVAMVFLQVHSAIEGLERSFGLDPADPIIPFVLFLSVTSTIWAIYWVVTYSGYAGDISPKLAFELLKGKERAVLVDVRPEDLKQRDGIPDLRRTARSRYADVSFPKVDGSLRKLMKSNKDLDDFLIASVIRNLKNVEDRSKIIVMDADGSRAKAIARSLRKLRAKRPYALHGGFQSWVKEGLRVKELKPETAISIFSEEAEAILEELSPSPVQLLGIGVGSIVALYALTEWEKSLQVIGLFGIAQTIYRRVASYQDSKDFEKDVRLLFSPVAIGAEALTWVIGKVETNGNGLPVMPSSSDVQSRVLQAAAKHESQPTEGAQDSVMGTTSVSENADPSSA